MCERDFMKGGISVSLVIVSAIVLLSLFVHISTLQLAIGAQTVNEEDRDCVFLCICVSTFYTYPRQKYGVVI